MKNKIIVLGRGYLGSEFAHQGYEVWGKDKFIIPSSIDSLKVYLDEYDTVINCIGKSNTRWCEKRENVLETLRVNAKFPAMLSMYCRINNKKFVHISTGCLYDEYTPQPCKETSFLVAHCNYTISKWIGELGCNPIRDLILRPRLYFSGTPDKNNLLCKIPKFTSFLTDMNSFSRTTDIVAATRSLLDNNQSGVFNVACDGCLSVWDISQLIGVGDFNNPKINGHELRIRENLYLVNNVMDIQKLKQFYQPPTIKEAVIECWNKLNK